MIASAAPIATTLRRRASRLCRIATAIRANLSGGSQAVVIRHTAELEIEAERLSEDIRLMLHLANRLDAGHDPIQAGADLTVQMGG